MASLWLICLTAGFAKAQDVTSTWDFNNTAVAASVVAATSTTDITNVEAVEGNGVFLTVEANGNAITKEENGIVAEDGVTFKVPVRSQTDTVYVAGADLAEDGHLLSNGGRVLGVTERGKDIREAIKKAYESVDKISFEHGFFRHDIGQRALKALED